jgi:DNA invertase Pin-like site-specific DNA recombinase
MFEEISKNRRFGYARVSSQTQEDNSSLEAQKQEFIQKGVPEKNIRVEVGSAADKIEERPVFYHLIDHELKENDLLLVTKIDRCSRNTLEFLKLQERLHKKGVRFISLDLPYSNDMAVNQLISTNLAAIATFENERRKERQRQGIQAAKKNGKYFGRKTVIDKKLISQVQDLKENKNLSITEISKITGRARNTIYKILKEELNYIPYNRLVKNQRRKQMKQNKLSFESLTVDYITFNFERLNESRKADLINYFYKLGFNSYDTDRKYRNAFDEPIKYNSKNLYQIRFIKNITPHWKGIAVAFPDDSAAYFYKLAKNYQIQWDLFDLGILSRFDLNYLRPLQLDEGYSVTQFLRTSQEEIRKKRINAKLESSLNQEILKIASRRSSRCARIYTTDNSLKFEIELRNNLIKDCNYLLVEVVLKN